MIQNTLFAYRNVSEAFLKKIMSLFVSSHYKNTPNDLQLLSNILDNKVTSCIKEYRKHDYEDENRRIEHPLDDEVIKLLKHL